MKQLHIASLLLPFATGWIANINASPTSLVPRSRNIAGGLLDLIDKLQGGDTDAWDYDNNPDLCLVWFSTYAGGGCQMKVECNTGTHEYNKFQVCEVGDKEKGDHQQYWHDPNIGDFSIQYTTTPQGLAGPILRFKNINDWEPLVVDDIAKPKDESGAQVCYYGVDGKSLWWGCGIPKLGKQGLDGFESNVPVGPGGYATGTCQMHVVQHQKPDPSKDPYSLEVWIKDANQDDIGAVYPRVKMTNNQLEVASKLPRPVVFRTGAVDADPISISYADDKWDTNNENRCNVGAYDGGMRQLDCDFECK